MCREQRPARYDLPELKARFEQNKNEKATGSILPSQFNTIADFSDDLRSFGSGILGKYFTLSRAVQRQMNYDYFSSERILARIWPRVSLESRSKSTAFAIVSR